MQPSHRASALAPSYLSLLLLVVVLFTARAEATPNIRTSFFNQYPTAVGTALYTLPSHANHCGVCHYNFSGAGTRTPYGERLKTVLGNFSNNDAGRRAAMAFIQNEDSDGDGYSNLTEITDTTSYGNTPTFPGYTPANVNGVSNVSAAELLNHLVPVTAADTTPPDVTVLSPNGGETLLGNSPVVVEWTATDAGGIARIDILLSLDNGVKYSPLARNVPYAGGVGQATVFIPNRPSATGRISVEATDNASNANDDASDSAFMIQSPPGGIAPTTLRDFDLPGTQPFSVAPLNSPDNCLSCHSGYNPSVEPGFNWQGSMMAHASRDLMFEACMAIANQDAPDSGDLCLRCHNSAGWLDGRSVPTSGAAMLAGDRIGVSCDLCHRMVDPVADVMNPAEDAAILASLVVAPTQFGNGMLVVDPSDNRRRGPFSDTVALHDVLVSPFHREAALCGSCHDVSNPAFEKDGNGNYAPNAFDAPPTDASSNTLMPIERTYSEWLHSAYNSPAGVFAPQFGGNRDFVSTCQDCHMRDVTGKGCNSPSASTRTDLPLHDMTGGSTWMLSLLPSQYPGDVNAAAINAGVTRARYMLQNAATMAVSQTGGDLLVHVVNETGHKLPSGYPEGRRMWINPRFFDAGDQLIGESGAYVASTGDLIHDAEIKVYEAKPGLDEVTAPLVGATPGPSFHFVLNNRIYKDNRIPPRGFANAAFSEFGGAPVGAVYADGQYWDDSLYAIPQGAVRVEVSLYYQSTSKEYVTFLRDANTTNSKGQEMYDLWNDNGKSPPELVQLQTLALAPIVAPGDIDGDGDIDDVDAGLFAGVLTGAETTTEYVTRSDLNDDSIADGADIADFIVAYLGS